MQSPLLVLIAIAALGGPIKTEAVSFKLGEQDGRTEVLRAWDAVAGRPHDAASQKVGKQFGRVEALLDWASINGGLDADTFKEAQEALGIVREAIRKNELTNAQAETILALEVSLVGIVEVQLACSRGHVPKAFLDLKEQFKKDWHPETRK